MHLAADGSVVAVVDVIHITHAAVATVSPLIYGTLYLSILLTLFEFAKISIRTRWYTVFELCYFKWLLTLLLGV